MQELSFFSPLSTSGLIKSLSTSTISCAERKPQEISCKHWKSASFVCSTSFDLQWQFSVYNLSGRWITAVFTVKNLNVFTVGFSCSRLLFLRLCKATVLCSLQTWDDSVSPWWFMWVIQLWAVKSRGALIQLYSERDRNGSLGCLNELFLQIDLRHVSLHIAFCWVQCIPTIQSAIQARNGTLRFQFSNYLFPGSWALCSFFSLPSPWAGVFIYYLRRALIKRSFYN